MSQKLILRPAYLEERRHGDQRNDYSDQSFVSYLCGDMVPSLLDANLFLFVTSHLRGRTKIYKENKKHFGQLILKSSFRKDSGKILLTLDVKENTVTKSTVW